MDGLAGFVKVSAREVQITSKVLKWQRQKIDQAAELKRIRWSELQRLMFEWVGTCEFSEMTQREGTIVLARLGMEPFRGMRG